MTSSWQYSAGVTSPAMPTGSATSVVFVCTGNVCRSPFAEMLLRKHLPALPVSSRGIHALTGQVMDKQMSALLALRGVSSVNFRARQIEAADLAADLIITMSERQRAFLLDEEPSTARRVGLLGHAPELAALCRSTTSGMSLENIAAWTRLSKPRGREIVDPYRRSRDVAQNSADMIDNYVSHLVRALTRSA